MPGACKRRATQPGGMPRWSRWKRYSHSSPKYPAVRSRGLAATLRHNVRKTEYRTAGP